MPTWSGKSLSRVCTDKCRLNMTSVDTSVLVFISGAVRSPHSAVSVLAMLYAGARDETATQLRDILGLANIEATAKSFGGTQVQLGGIQNVTLDMANRLYLNEGFQLQSSYLEILQNHFQTRPQTVDFAQRQAAAGAINQWVEERTHQRIKHLVQPGMFSADTAAV